MVHLVYIPGLGDRFDPLRRLALRRWRGAGVTVTFVPMRWNDHRETYEQKYERIAEAIARIEHGDVTLVGESAGGAMALLAFSRQRDRVGSVVTICGYNHGAADVHHYHKRTHPAFYHMMPIVDEIVGTLSSDMRRLITTIYSTRDHVVTPAHSCIDGARETVVYTPGHLLAIARVLLGRRPSVFTHPDTVG